jgi:hypothetical protein
MNLCSGLIDTPLKNKQRYKIKVKICKGGGAGCL